MTSLSGSLSAFAQALPSLLYLDLSLTNIDGPLPNGEPHFEKPTTLHRVKCFSQPT